MADEEKNVALDGVVVADPVKITHSEVQEVPDSDFLEEFATDSLASKIKFKYEHRNGLEVEDVDVRRILFQTQKGERLMIKPLWGRNFRVNYYCPAESVINRSYFVVIRGEGVEREVVIPIPQ
jgi:hypothetical protein